MSTTWGELTGDTTTDAETTRNFLEWWFTADDIVALRCQLGDEKWKTIARKRDDILGWLLSPAIEGLTPLEIAGSDGTNVYFCIAPVAVEKNLGSDGIKKRSILGHRGVFADVDCGKDGAFETPEALDAWIESLPVMPGAIVYTGSGGVHLYWKTTEHLGDDYGDVLRRWWSYLQSTAPEGVHIDRLVDATRIARVPGAVRHPLGKKLQPATPVTVEYVQERHLDAAMFHDLSDDAYAPMERRMKARKAADVSLTDQTLAGADLPFSWGRAAVLADVDRIVTETLTWDDILTPHGWTLYRDAAGDGTRQWTRPGPTDNEKSATTDWAKSPDVMSLFSDSVETGLADLDEAEVPLSKWRVYLRLEHDDNVEQALSALRELQE